MPDLDMWDRDGKWTIENHGVDPDIEVEKTPSDWWRGATRSSNAPSSTAWTS